jgi:hypothetical protein
MQTTLEKHAIVAREEQNIVNDYSRENTYSLNHPDAISDGDVHGKGFGVTHGHSIPDPYKPKNLYEYSIPTYDGGNKYDIEGRENVEGGRLFLESISLYGRNRQYGEHLINTYGNDGQYRITDVIK